MSSTQKNTKPEEAADKNAPKVALQDEDDWADFPAEDWAQGTKTSEVDWEKSWDDEENDEDFRNELRAEIAKRDAQK